MAKEEVGSTASSASPAPTAPTAATFSAMGVTLACHALKCPNSTGRNLGKSGQAWRFSFPFAWFQCATIATLHQSSSATCSGPSMHRSCLSGSRGGGEKQAGSLSSSHTLLFFPVSPAV